MFPRTPQETIKKVEEKPAAKASLSPFQETKKIKLKPQSPSISPRPLARQAKYTEKHVKKNETPPTTTNKKIKLEPISPRHHASPMPLPFKAPVPSSFKSPTALTPKPTAYTSATSSGPTPPSETPKKKLGRPPGSTIKKSISGDTDSIPVKRKSKYNAENVSNDSEKESKSETNSRRVSLFIGVKSEKVCQVCLKNRDGGEVLKCRGPCGLPFHLDCSEKERFEIKLELKEKVNIVKRKRGGRPCSVNPLPSPVLSENQNNGNERPGHQALMSPPVLAGPPDMPFNPDGTPMKRKRVKGFIGFPKESDKYINRIAAKLNSIHNVLHSSEFLINAAPKKLKIEECNIEPSVNETIQNYLSSTEKLVVNKSPSEEIVNHVSSQVVNYDSQRKEIPITLEMNSYTQILDNEVLVDNPTICDNKPKTESMPVLPDQVNHVDSESDKVKKFKWMCSVCANGKLRPCFVCSKNDDDAEKLRCGYCNKVYHDKCAQLWPQGQKTISAKGKVLYHCPQHTCHTCASDNPSGISTRFARDKLVHCVRCPATYHYGNYCIPAGTEILSTSQILCPKHYKPHKKALHHLSASWCMLCADGGSLICCELCPNSFHLKCLNLTQAPQGSFYCEDCETGRFPLFGEIVWVKFGAYRWWPARILFPQEIPDKILQVPHLFGDFAVEFFGTHDYHWANRGRCFLYQEGDGCSQNKRKWRIDKLFKKSVEESEVAFAKWTEERANREATTKKPPKYQNILSNKMVGNVSKYIVTSDKCLAPTCDCDPKKPNPCGPDSDCINRLLSIECVPEVCPARENCCNQHFKQRRYPRLMPFKTNTRGWGIKTLDPLPKGSFIIEYVGEMIDEEEYKKRLAAMLKNNEENFYFLALDKDRMIDSARKGNLSRFMNHSCVPNCETQKWTVNGGTRIGLFALENIQPDTELVFNYNLETISNNKVECKCGSYNCTGFIGVKNNSKQKNRYPKSQTPSSEEKKVEKKKRKRKAKHSEDSCFTCGNGREQLLCDDASCPKP